MDSEGLNFLTKENLSMSWTVGTFVYVPDTWTVCLPHRDTVCLPQRDIVSASDKSVRARPGTLMPPDWDKILTKWVAINAPELPGTAFCTEFRAGSF